MVESHDLDVGRLQGALKALEDRVARHEFDQRHDFAGMRLAMEKMSENILSLREAYERGRGVSSALIVVDRYVRMAIAAIVGGIATYFALPRK
ncbi:MAG: hypothetical protein ACYDDA_10810 [Acidiferrobacteraceae bacterium]